MFKTPKILVTILIFCWTVLGFFYYNSPNAYLSMREELPESMYRYIGNESFLINTTGCVIPNYGKTMKFVEKAKSPYTCGPRLIFVSKMPPDKLKVTFKADALNMKYKIKPTSCYYSFAFRSNEAGKEDTKVNYTKAIYFVKDIDIIPFKTEYLRIRCRNDPEKKILYEDHYIILKKRHTQEKCKVTATSTSWNILVIGLDTMSRARTMYNMPKTVHYLLSNGWIDYKGYQKVAFNTFPNVMSLLSGMKLSTINKLCDRMDPCVPLLLWKKFKESGYVTAYGEDSLSLPDTFSGHHGFTIPPTDHYMRPFFLLGEQTRGNSECSGQVSTAAHIFNYTKEFAKTYKNESFFGFFWINSFGHQLNQLPSIHDSEVVNFFKNLKKSSVLENTFVLFLSDHGIRFGSVRRRMEAYYEERLPMLYIWVPYQFRKQYPELYNNLMINQHRLTTPYNIYMTLQVILHFSNNTVLLDHSEACPNCTSLFVKQSELNGCSEAGVDEKWCSCHSMDIPRNKTELKGAINEAVAAMEYIVKSVKTKKCTMCKPLKLVNIVRNHTYQSGDFNYYVLGIEMDPGKFAYELTVKTNGTKYEVLSPTHSISPFKSYGNCMINNYDKSYCYCQNIKNCTVRKKNKKNKN